MPPMTDQPSIDRLAMRLTINGEQHEYESGITLTRLLELLDLQPERVAVEVNRQIVRRGEWSSLALQDGDRVEVVQLVGGGSGGERKKESV